MLKKLQTETTNLQNKYLNYFTSIFTTTCKNNFEFRDFASEIYELKFESLK